MKKAIVHFEIGCSDIPETANFYQKIFDWNINAVGNSAQIDTGRPGAIPGHLNKLAADEPQNYINIYIETDSLEEDLKAIEEHGGEVVVKATKLPDGRSFAWFKDIAGNTVGLISDK